jgi:hypothetical protein
VRARVAILLALAAAVVLAGCGGGGGDDGRTDYATALNRAQNGLLKRVNQLNTRITPTSTPAQDRRTLAAYETAVGTAVKDLRAIDPPDDLQRLHQQFVGEVAEYGTVVHRARTQLNGSRRAALAARSELPQALQRVAQKLNVTIKAINTQLQG